jgi:hypothetical protein
MVAALKDHVTVRGIRGFLQNAEITEAQVSAMVKRITWLPTHPQYRGILLPGEDVLAQIRNEVIGTKMVVSDWDEALKVQTRVKRMLEERLDARLDACAEEEEEE